jgi:hypothetical protein
MKTIFYRIKHGHQVTYTDVAETFGFLIAAFVAFICLFVLIGHLLCPFD